jgi:hypothetical protein
MATPFVARLALILLATLVLAALITYYHKSRKSEAFVAPVRDETLLPLDTSVPAVPSPEPQADGAWDKAPFNPPMAHATMAPAANEPLSNELYRPVVFGEGGTVPADTFPSARLTPEDLIPGTGAATSAWAQANPAGQGDLRDVNLMTAGYQLGVDTVGQSMRNANVGLRSEPPNPQYAVGPWQNSTIGPDLMRRPLE